MKTKKGNEQGTHTPSSELGPKLRHRAGPHKVNEESGCGRTRKGNERNKANENNNFLEIQHKLSQKPGLGTKKRLARPRPP